MLNIAGTNDVLQLLLQQRLCRVNLECCSCLQLATNHGLDHVAAALLHNRKQRPKQAPAIPRPLTFLSTLASLMPLSNIPNTFCPLGSSEASEPSKSTGLLHLAPSGATLLPLPPAVIAACLELRPPSNMPVTTSKLNFSTEAFAAMILQDKGNPSSVQQRPQLPPVSVARATINKSQNHKN